MVFGGSDAPTALGCVYSLGGINMANNGKIQAGVTDVLEKYGVAENRIISTFLICRVIVLVGIELRLLDRCDIDMQCRQEIEIEKFG